ncbi:MAG: hypothetical protein IRY95_07620 [Clostridia bacterium]|nr:hypothetical protein [Clostridia bacterium]
MEAERVAADPFVLTLYRRVFNGAADQIHLFFAADVLDRYRSQGGYEITRTDTAGRLKRPGGWSLDFGIAADDRLIHVPAGDLATRLPASERDHWLAHLVHLPHSRHFVRVRMAPGSCFADGDIRPW